MNATISRNSLLSSLLTLSKSNQKWIADHLYENIRAPKKAKTADALFDPETGRYLNEDTMKAIRDSEAGIGIEEFASVEDFMKMAEALYGKDRFPFRHPVNKEKTNYTYNLTTN